MKTGLRHLLLVGAIQVAALVVFSLVLAIYPGAFTVTAPVLCPDGQPDAFMVRYDVQSPDGNGSTYTMFCMDNRGQFTEVGTFKPLLVAFAALSAAMLVTTLPVVALTRSSRRNDTDA